MTVSQESLSSIFISYARDDDETFVETLQRDLRRAGLNVWWDREAMTSRGRTFLQEIRDAVVSSRRLILVLGPRAVESPYVQAEWQLAAELCIPIVPILRLGDYALLPPELARLHCIDVRETRAYGRALSELVRVLSETIPAAAALLGVESLPRHFVPRDAELSRLSGMLLADVQRPTVIRSAQQTASLQGMGGVGKSVLAAAFARGCDTRRAFDTIVWLSVGPGAESLPLLQQLGTILDAPVLSQSSSLPTARATLSAMFADKSLLIVLDDVWDMSQAETVSSALGPRCRLLVTTRDGGLARALGAEELPVDSLDEEQALLLLARWSDQAIAELPPEAAEVAAECGYLPLALAMIGAMVRGKPNHWTHALTRLRAADLQKIRRRFPNYPYPDLFRAIEVSVQTLEAGERAAYIDLAVFRKGTAIPESAMAALWGIRHGMTEADVTDIVDTLVDRSLARRNERGFLLLHALQEDFIRQTAGELKPLHRDLLEGYRLCCPDGWSSGPDDGYYFDSLPHHLALSGEVDELTTLLSDYAWLEAKLRATSVQSVIFDYDLLPPNSSLSSVKRALRQSSHVLTADRTQLATQLLGRFVNTGDSAIQQLNDSALGQTQGIWLQPLVPCLRAPNDALIATLAGHTDQVNAVAISADGRRAVSGSSDHTIRLWDLVELRLLNTFVGHTDSINAVAITPDGRFAVSGAGCPRPFKMEIQMPEFLKGVDLRPSRDTSIRIWDLDEGREVQRLEGHTAAVRTLIFIADGKALVSGGDDSTLRLWAFGKEDSGIELGKQGGRVVFLAERGSAGQVFSFSEFNFKLWDLIRSREVEGKFDIWRNVVGMDAERQKILLQYTTINGGTFSLEVWDLEHKDLDTEKIDLVDSFTTYIRTATYVSGGGAIAAGLSNGSIKICETINARTKTLRGHRGEIAALAPTPEGKRLLSASHDGTLMLWDLTVAPETVESARDVNAVAFTPTGRLAVAAFSDTAVEVWDVTTRTRLYNYDLKLHVFDLRMVDEDVAMLGFAHGAVGFLDVRNGEITQQSPSHWDSVMTLDAEHTSALAASGSLDKLVKIWNLRQRRELMTLEGHPNSVLGVAVLPGGQRAVSGDTDGNWFVWDLTHRRKERELHEDDRVDIETKDTRIRWKLTGPEMRSARRTFCAVAALQDGKHCVTAAKGSIVVWDVTTGERVNSLDRPSSDSVQTLRVSYNGKLLVSTDTGHSCDIWDLTSWKHLTRFTFDSSNLVCDIGGSSPTLVAGVGGLPRDIAFLQLRNSS
jgi:WD40 repeat protein